MTAWRKVNTKSQTWWTPKKYVDAVKKVFWWEIELDPCSNEYSIVNAKTEYTLPKNDWLKDSWNYKTIYVNPPYGISKETKTSIKHWLKKCDEANKKYQSEVIALIPVAPNTSHWKNHIFSQATAICFLYDTRLKFLENWLDVWKGAPMACCTVYWGSNYKKFYKTFIKYGAVLDLRALNWENIWKS